MKIEDGGVEHQLVLLCYSFFTFSREISRSTCQAVRFAISGARAVVITNLQVAMVIAQRGWRRFSISVLMKYSRF